MWQASKIIDVTAMDAGLMNRPCAWVGKDEQMQKLNHDTTGDSETESLYLNTAVAGVCL